MLTWSAVTEDNTETTGGNCFIQHPTIRTDDGLKEEEDELRNYTYTRSFPLLRMLISRTERVFYTVANHLLRHTCYNSEAVVKHFYTTHTISTAVTGVINAGCYYKVLMQSEAQTCIGRKQHLYAQCK